MNPQDRTETDHEPPPPYGGAQGAAHRFAQDLKKARYAKDRPEQLLGEGGIGRVVVAHETLLRRPIAMKSLLLGEQASDHYKDRLIREARITGILEHPSIVPVHDMGENEEGEIFFTMKKVEGLTLAQVIEKLGPDKAGVTKEEKAQRAEIRKRFGNISSRLEIIQKVCDATAFAHAHPLRVIHRDIKPENIMVGKFGEVLVMDWGLAKVLGKTTTAEELKENEREIDEDLNSTKPSEGVPFGASQAHLTMEGQFNGTLAYASPEQIEGKLDEIDEKSDVYALGGLLYHLLTLEPPLPLAKGDAKRRKADPAAALLAEKEAALRLINARQTAPLLRQIGAKDRSDSVPEALRPLVLSALEPEAAKRIRSAVEIKEAITQFQDGFANTFENASPWKHFTYFVKRHKAVSFATAAALLIVSGLSVFFTSKVTKEKDRANESAVLTTKTLADARLQQAVEKLNADDSFAALPYALSAHQLRGDDAVASALIFSMLTHHVPSVPSYAPIHLGGEPISFSVNSDHTKLVTAGMGIPMSVWSLVNGRKLAEVPASSSEMSYGGFTVDGKGIFHQSDKDLHFRCWKGSLTEAPAIELGLPLTFRFLPFSAEGGPMLGTLPSEATKSAEVIMGKQSHFSSLPVALADVSEWKRTAETKGDGIIHVAGAHSSWIVSIVMSRDGRRAATGDEMGTVITWDTVQRKKLAEIGFKSKVNSLSFSPDGNVVLVGTKAGTLSRHDVVSGNRLSYWSFGTDACLTAINSGDGNAYGASSAGDKGWVQLWDAGNARRISYHKAGFDVKWLSMAKEAQTLFCAGDWKGFSLFDVPSRRENQANLLHRFRTTNAGWSESSGLAWVLDESHTLRTYHTDVSALSCILLPHAGKGEHAHFSPDGRKLLIIASKPDCHQVWDVASGLPHYEPVEHDSAVISAGFSSDSSTVFVACRDGSIGSWSASDGEQKAELAQVLGQGGASSQLSHDKRWLAQIRIDMTLAMQAVEMAANSGLTSEDVIADLRSGIKTHLVLHDLSTGRSLPPVELPGQYYQVMCSNTGNTVAVFGAPSVGESMNVVVLINGKVSGTVPLSGVGAGSDVFKMSRSGNFAVVSEGARGAVLFGLNPVRVIAHLPHLQEINASAFSSDETLVATASDDGTAQVWRCADGKAVGKALRHTSGSAVYGVAFSPNNKWVATAGADNVATIWDARTGQRASINLTANDSLRHVEFSPDGKWLTTCGDDGNVRLWEWLPSGHEMPPPWIDEVVPLVSERIIGMDGNEQVASGWVQAAVLAKARALPPGPWRAAVENLFLPASERTITPTAGFALGQDRLRQARCQILLGKHEDAIHPVRLALKAQPELVIPKELESVRRLIVGTALDCTTIQESPGEHLEGAGTKAGERHTNGQAMSLRWCPPGSFMMGSRPGSVGRWGNESYRQVYLTRGYWVGETEVTQGQWRKMMNQSLFDLAGAAIDDKTTYRFDGETKPAQTIREKLGLTADITVEKIVGIQDDDFPVYWVTQAQARTFCERLTINERAAGRLDDAWTYRLPTEAEWEYACRAGTAGTLHVGELRKESGNLNAPELNDFGWYGGNSCQDYPQGPGWNCESWAGRAFPGIKAGPRKVGQKNPNAWGLFDTLGNLQEWTSSIEDDRLTMQRVNPERSKAGPADKAIFRGGCWNNFALGCRTSSRSTEHPAFRSHYVGFRVVLALKDKGDGD